VPKPGAFAPSHPQILSQIAKRIVEESHAKSLAGRGGYLPDTPIGRGGKMDDTSVVVGEVVEWTEAHSKVWAQVRKQREWRNMVTCGGMNMDNITCRSCQRPDVDADEVDLTRHSRTSRTESNPQGGTDSGDEEDEKNCTIQ